MIECFSKKEDRMRGIFPVMGAVRVGDLDLEILEGLGGHTWGQIYLYSEKHGLLFAADSVINFSSLTKERADYSSLAAFLVTSVNVDSDLAKKERRALLEIAYQTDKELTAKGKRCLICGGHGAVSVLENNKLIVKGSIQRYQPHQPCTSGGCGKEARITGYMQEWVLVVRTVFFPHMHSSLFSKEKNHFDCKKNNYEILIYYVDASFVQEIWKDTEYRI